PLELVSPRGRAVDVRLDHELPTTERRRLEGTAPTICLVVFHRHLEPCPGPERAVLHRGAEDLVAVTEDVGPDVDLLAECPLDGVAAAVEHRPDVLDLDPRRRGSALRQCHGPHSISGRNVRMNRVRSSGVLLHPTSLPDGRLGKHAYRFVDWLAAAGQS